MCRLRPVAAMGLNRKWIGGDRHHNWRCEAPDRIFHAGIVMNLALPTIFTVIAAIAFFTLERMRPGRELPNSRGWYGRAVLVNLAQIAITLGTNHLWLKLFSGAS